MERLKVTGYVKNVARNLYLHSSMERLKAAASKHGIKSIVHLHSSMERLKGGPMAAVMPKIVIYIPVWRD